MALHLTRFGFSPNENVGFWRLCWAIWKLCWDYVGQLGALLAVFEGNVGSRLCSAICGSVGVFLRLCWAIWGPCWDYVRQLVARVAVFGGYVGPFGGYVGTMWGSLGGI